MKEHYLKKGLLILLAVMLVISVMPITAFAADNTATVILTQSIHTDLEISWYQENDGTTSTVTSSGNTVSVSTGGGFSSTWTYVTFTNTSKVNTYTLSFDCTYSKAKSGSTLAISSDTKTLAPGASVTYNLGSNGFFSKATASLTNISFVLVEAAEYNIAVNYDSLLGNVVGSTGTTTINSTGCTVTIDPGSSVTLTATPANGAKFVCWYDSTGVLSRTTTCTITPTGDTGLNAVFSNGQGNAYFAVGSASSSRGITTVSQDKVFDNLADAISYASSNSAKYITPLNDGIVPAGDYTIPSGITLLIPYNDSNTLYTTAPEKTGDAAYETPIPYRTLTLASGASLTVNGNLSLSNKVNYASNKVNEASPTGAVSMINMESDSSIIINGNLYAWGYIVGEGMVTANSGSTIYECFQFMGYRGGDQSTDSNMSSYGVFPISQYYVQNIEVPLKLMAGANEIVYTLVYATSIPWDSTAKFVGSSNSMFTISDGYLIKQYDGATDRLVAEIYGDVTISPINLKVSSSSINSEAYELPITHNMTIKIESGTVTTQQDLAILPGANIEIGENGNLILGSGKNLYIYDADEWGNFVYTESFGSYLPNNRSAARVPFQVLYYAPGRHSGVDRQSQDLTDAIICVNGTLDASVGYIYTTESGANIYSTGTGTVMVNAGTQDVTYQVIQDTVLTDNEYYVTGDNDTYVKIPIDPALLLNSDSTYTATADSTTSPNTYTYTNGKWICKTHTGVTTDHTCDVCGFVEGCVYASPTDHKCSICGVSSECVDDNSTDHICDICGKAFLFDIYATSISVTDSLNMYFYIKADDLVDGIVTDKTVGQGYYAVINRAYTGNDTEKKKEIKISSEDWSVEPHGDVQCVRFCYDNISAKEMTDAISVVIYNSNDVQVSQSYTETVKDYAIRTLNCYEGESNASMRKALVDMLNYGAACQDYFKYNNEPEKLANYQLDSKFAGEATQQDPVCTSYLEDTVNMVAASISARNRLMYTFYFKNISSDMRAIVIDETGNQLLEITGMATDSTPGFIQYGNWLGVDVTGLSMVDGRRMLTCKVYNGNTLVASGTDSVEGYVKRAKDAGLNQPVFGMLMRFVDSAIAYSNS